MASRLRHAFNQHDASSISSSSLFTSRPRHPAGDSRVFGVISIVLELCLLLENLMPVLVVVFWKRPRERSVNDKLLASLSATYVMSAVVPTPLGLVSYFHGGWYGGAATCECFQVTSTWCSLSALALVTYLAVDLFCNACQVSTVAPPTSPSSSRSRSEPAVQRPWPRQTLTQDSSDDGQGIDEARHQKRNEAVQNQSSGCRVILLNDTHGSTQQLSSPTASSTQHSIRTTQTSDPESSLSNRWPTACEAAHNHHGLPVTLSTNSRPNDPKASDASDVGIASRTSDAARSPVSSRSHSSPQTTGSCVGSDVPTSRTLPTANRPHQTWKWAADARGAQQRDCANILLFFLFTLSLFISSLPVIGYGPPIMPSLDRDNTSSTHVPDAVAVTEACDSWLIPTPPSPRRRTFYVTYLAFGFLNILLVVLGVVGAVCLLRTAARRTERKSLSRYRWSGERRYTEENGSRCCCDCGCDSCMSKRDAHVQRQYSRHQAEVGNKNCIASASGGPLSKSACVRHRASQCPACHGVGASRLFDEREMDGRDAADACHRVGDWRAETCCECDGGGGGGCGGGERRREWKSYKMAGLILANQAMWVPALVIVTLQKTGHPISDATVMYAVMSTSLPGLLNPLLLALLYGDYRRGYLNLLRRLCCCCTPRRHEASIMKSVRFRHRGSSVAATTDDPAAALPVSVDIAALQDDLTCGENGMSKARCAKYTYPKRTGSSNTGGDFSDSVASSSYIVVEIPTERTPLQGGTIATNTTSSSRPIVASLYDEYGELSCAPKTELLSPCGSQECLLSPELFRAQTESIV